MNNTLQEAEEPAPKLSSHQPKQTASRVLSNFFEFRRFHELSLQSCNLVKMNVVRTGDL